MKLFVLPLTFLSLLSVASADALHDQINSVDASVSAALAHKDMDAFTKILKPLVTPTFTYSEPGQKPMGFDLMVSTMKKGLAGIGTIKFAEAKLLSIKPTGSTMTALSTHKMIWLSPGKDKKSHTFDYALLSTDVYQKVGGTWRKHDDEGAEIHG